MPRRSNSLESVDEGMIHSEQNVYTEYADPKRTEWITKIQPALNKPKLEMLVATCENRLSSATNHRVAGGRRTASQDSGITRINPKKARFPMRGAFRPPTGKAY